jgi:hypothetical protein
MVRVTAILPASSASLAHHTHEQAHPHTQKHMQMQKTRCVHCSAQVTRSCVHPHALSGQPKRSCSRRNLSCYALITISTRTAAVPASRRGVNEQRARRQMGTTLSSCLRLSWTPLGRRATTRTKMTAMAHTSESLSVHGCVCAWLATPQRC